MSIRADDLLLLEKGMLVLPEDALPTAPFSERVNAQDLGTVLANFAWYGVVPSARFLAALRETDENSFDKAWTRAEALLSAGSGDDRNMDDHVVYKNFPGEVLEMNEAEYWIRQILMYLGLPNEIFTEEPVDRAPLDETVELRVIELVTPFKRDALDESLKQSRTRWRPIELDAAIALFKRAEARAPGRLPVRVGDYAFRANALTLAVSLRPDFPGLRVETSSASDVLRLASGLSGFGVEMQVRPRFISFPRATRRFLIDLLEHASDLEGDFARRPELWKRLLSRLHPGEFNAPRVSAAYDSLYKGLPERFNARLEAALKAEDPAALDILASEPGAFARELTRAYATFGRTALARFLTVAGDVSSDRLLQIERHLLTLDQRSHRLVRPRGRWDKAQAIGMPSIRLSEEDQDWFVTRLRALRKARLDTALPDGVALDGATKEVVLPVNGQELAPYGPGTVFEIPAEMTFLRTASYWAHRAGGDRNTWFDNGWNFFDADWNDAGVCCWNRERQGDGAVFSGDPTNSQDLAGRGCQMIDLYLDELEAEGITYAVWSLLCYSHVPFADAEDVLATLQWGVDAEEGQLFEPSRAQMTFPVKGDGLTRFIAYIDIPARKLVALDLGLPGTVRTAAANGKRLATLMPAVIDHITSLPRVHDLFDPAAAGALPVRRRDDTAPVTGPGWVFETRDEESAVEAIDLAQIRGATG